MSQGVECYSCLPKTAWPPTSQHFRPEFLNRVDDIIVFPHLSKDEITQIVDLEIAKLDKRLKDKDMGMELTVDAKNLLAKKGYDPVLGARPLRRTIQREIEDALSERILFNELKPGQKVLVDVEGDYNDVDNSKLIFTGSQRPASEDAQAEQTPPAEVAAA